MRIKIPSGLIAFFVLLQYTAVAQVQDAAVWASIAFQREIHKKHELYFKTQSRISENVSMYDYSFFDFGVSNKLKKNISWDLSYVYNMRRMYTGEYFVMRPRHQFYTNITFSHSLNNLKLATRNQFQTDLEDEFTRDDYNQDFFYRNKLSLRYKLNKHWNPYMYYEFYLRLNNRRPFENTIQRNRWSAGVEYDITKRKSITFYYLLQQQVRRGGPELIHVYGIAYQQDLSKKKKKKKNKAESLQLDNDADGR